MGQQINLNTSGMQCIGAYLAKPTGAARGGIVVVQDLTARLLLTAREPQPSVARSPPPDRLAYGHSVHLEAVGTAAVYAGGIGSCAR